MSKQLRGAFLATGVAALLAFGASNLLAAGKMQPALQIKAGLWEFDSTGKVDGDSVFRSALLAGVPPAQRAQRLALLRQGISQPSKERVCLTQAFFDRVIFSPVGTGCKRTVLSNSASKIEVVTECRAEDHGWKDESSNRAVVSAASSTISEHGVSSEAGKTMIRDTVQRGHWIGSNCGNLQPFRAP